MKILFATSECAPFSKSGGLADVAFSLPPALKKAGNEVAIITPLYQGIREKFGKNFKLIKETGVRMAYDTQYCGLFRGAGRCYGVLYRQREHVQPPEALWL